MLLKNKGPKRSAPSKQILILGILAAVNARKVGAKRNTVNAFRWEYCANLIDAIVVIARIPRKKSREG